MTPKCALFAVLALLLLVPEARAQKTGALPNTRTIRRARPRQPTPPEGFWLKAKLEALIAAAGGNRTAGGSGNARALAWLKAEAEAINKEHPGAWQIEAREFTPDIDYALRMHRADIDKFKTSDPNTFQVKQATAIYKALTAELERVRGKKGVNLVLRKVGSEPKLSSEVVLVGAHFDTITAKLDPLELYPDGPAPGASDNGSSVALLIALAKDLATLKPRRTLELVFFDWEEEFFLGSRAYATELEKKGVAASLVNLEMLGYNEGDYNIIKVYQRSESNPGWERDAKLARKVGDALNLKGKFISYIVKNNFDRSDNWSFWQARHAAIAVSHDWEDGFDSAHYHSATDTPEHLDWEYLYRVRVSLAAAIPLLVN